MKKIIIIVVMLFLVLLLIAGAALFVLTNKSAITVDSEEEGVETAEETVEKPERMYLEIRPPFVVTISSNDKSYFLQVETALLAYNQEDYDAMEANQPAIKAALVDLYSEQNVDFIKTKLGKDELKQAALQEIENVMKEAYGKKAVRGIFFTKFVIQ